MLSLADVSVKSDKDCLGERSRHSVLAMSTGNTAGSKGFESYMYKNLVRNMFDVTTVDKSISK